MGPPLRSWRKEVRVFRNGTPCCTEMLTQIAEKSPKWTIAGKQRDFELEEKAKLPGPSGVIKPSEKYPRIPVYSFPQGESGGRMRRPRPTSAPTGPKYVPRTRPTTPRYSFGKCPRQSPFPPHPGPGPAPQVVGRAYPPQEGPKYSCTPRRPLNFYGHGSPDSPGPNQYRPRRPRSAHGPRWAPDPENPTRTPRSPGDDGPPGPDYLPDQLPPGPRFSFRPKLEEKPDDNWRQLGPQWTYFGYNDFGHTDCSHANCRDIPTFHAKPGEKFTTKDEGRQTDSSGMKQPETWTAPERPMKPRRPSSAPAGGRRYVRARADPAELV